MKSRFVVSCILFLIFTIVHGQNLPVVNGTYHQTDLNKLIIDFEDQSGYPFYFEETWIDSLNFTGNFNNESIENALNKVFQKTPIIYTIYDQCVFLTYDIAIITNPQLERFLSEKVNDEELGGFERGLIFSREYLDHGADDDDVENYVFEIGSRKNFQSGGKSIIAGYIRQSGPNEPLVGASVYIKDFSVASFTDENGFYSITLPNGPNTLYYQYSGMKPTRRNVLLFSSGQLGVEMNVDLISLQEVTVEAHREDNVQNVAMGVSKIDVAATKNVPIVLGERDILKVATTLAGVQKVGEGAAGFNVRGGKSDQNQIQLNDATIYNASHFFGFFSVFNSDAIDDMDIYKSSIPAEYGGRLSSVFDIVSKESNVQEFSGSGGISPITSRLTFEIPIIKDKSGLMIGARSTYSNWVLKRAGNAQFSENRVSFADLIMRYDHKFNEKNDLRVSSYFSHDKFRLTSDSLFSFSNFSYVNYNISAKLTHHFSNNLTGQIIGVYSGYNYELTYDESPPNAFIQDFGIKEYTIKADIAYYQDDLHTLKAGIESKLLKVAPGSKVPTSIESTVIPVDIDSEQGLQNSIYISDEYNLTKILSAYAGLRYSAFSTFGPQTVFNYLNGEPRNIDTRTDSIVYGRGEHIRTYHGPEFRFAARYQINKSSSLKAGFNRMRQYVHTLTNSASLSPTDTWRLSNSYLKPQISDQYSVGFFKNLRNNMIETSIELYFKDLRNLLDFKVGSDFLLNPNVESIALQGPGKSYGLELSLKKSGKLNGWINYSYARTFIRLDGNSPEETINNGHFFPANYDIPHTFNLVANYKVTHRLSASYNFTFNSGRPVTYPVGVYSVRGVQSVHYTDRNAYRIPYYMRMDLGVNLDAGHRLNKLAHSYWTFSVYNLLGRNNPFSVFFDIRDGKANGYQLVVFGNPIPTVSYNFKF